jgi:IS30 family transposase
MDAQHAAFTMATNIVIYFCVPQRGTVENINGREYFPKGIGFNTVTKCQISKG